MCSISNIRLTAVCSRFEFEAPSRPTAVKKGRRMQYAAWNPYSCSRFEFEAQKSSKYSKIGRRSGPATPVPTKYGS